jgi:hypothetical protein
MARSQFAIICSIAEARKPTRGSRAVRYFHIPYTFKPFSIRPMVVRE